MQMIKGKTTIKKVNNIFRMTSSLIPKIYVFGFCSSFNQNQTSLQQLRRVYHSKPIFTVFQPLIRDKYLNHFQVFNIAKRQPFSLSFYQPFKQYLDSVVERNDNYYLLKGKVVSEIGIYFLRRSQIQKAKQKLLQALQVFQESMVPPILPYHKVYRTYGIALYINKQFQQAKEVLIECTTVIKRFIDQSQDKVSQSSMQQAVAYTYLISLDSPNQRQWAELAQKEWDQIQDQKFQSQVYAQFLVNQIKALRKLNKVKEAQRLFKRQIPLIQNQQIRLNIEQALKDTF